MRLAETPVIDPVVTSARCLVPPLLRVAHPLRQLFVLRRDRGPTHRGSAPAIIVDRHVDAAVDKELHRFVILVPHQLMQDAGGLMGAPVCVDIGSMPEKKVGDLEMVVYDREGKRGVKNLLHSGLAPFQISADPVIVGGKMLCEVAQGGLARGVEPASNPCEVPAPRSAWQIVGHRPDPQQHRKQMGLPIGERVNKGSTGPVVGDARGCRWHRTVQYGRIEIEKRLKESCTILERRRRPLD